MLSSLVACARAEMSAVLLAQRARCSFNQLSEEVSLAVVVLGGVARHAAILSLLDGGLRTLAAHWGAEAGFLDAAACLGTVVAPAVVFGRATLPDSFDPLAPGVLVDCPLSNLLFGAALAAGWLALGLYCFASSLACGGGGQARE